MMPYTDTITSIPMMPQSMCCFPSLCPSPPSRKLRRNSTIPHTKRRNPAVKTMRIIGSITYVVNLFMRSDEAGIESAARAAES